MTLWWIGDIVLLVVVVPVVVYLLNGVLTTARSIVPSVRRIATVPRRLEGPRRHALLLTRRRSRWRRRSRGSPSTAARST
jgi:hypothetical protein